MDVNRSVTGRLATGISDLPTELFHNILDHLECGGHIALSACTLVCRGWLEISRQHLFSELHVLRACDESFEDLADFLETHQTHASCVRTLSLEPRLFSLPPRASLMPPLTATLLYRIVRAVPNIHRICLRQLRIVQSLDQALLSSLRLQRLEHLEYETCLADVANTFSLLTLFRIEHLDFDPLFPDDYDVDVQAGDRPLYVRSLCVSPLTEQPLIAFQALQQVVPPNMIQTFRYPSLEIKPNPPPVATFLRDLGQNIVDLHICPSSEDDYLVLPLLPRLQIFRFQPSATLLTPSANVESQRYLLSPFKDYWLPHLPINLEQLVLYVTYGDDVVADTASMPLFGLETSLSRFHRLKKLTIIFPDLPCAMKCARAALAVCFPTAHAKGILEAEVRDWDSECREWDIYGYLRDY